MVYLSFVFDHRVMDGEGADGFLKTVKDLLESWPKDG
jgi:pyruvate/2-oxoglutarate dehydrogenase complex dihydrolipoamide acyltransferase (E2) component